METISGVVLGVGLTLGGAGVIYGSWREERSPEPFEASASRISGTAWRVIGVVSIILGILQLALVLTSSE
jgi:hypothetical protein